MKNNKWLMMFLLCGVLAVTNTAWGQGKIGSTDALQLNKRIANNDTIYIVNYWSTTCIPCIQELPYFERIHEKYKGKPVKVILLSFDFKEDYANKLPNWVTKKKLKSEVIWFSEQKPNVYIPKLNPKWEGSLPATTISYKKKKYYWFKEGKVTEAELTKQLDALLK